MKYLALYLQSLGSVDDPTEPPDWLARWFPELLQELHPTAIEDLETLDELHSVWAWICANPQCLKAGIPSCHQVRLAPDGYLTSNTPNGWSRTLICKCCGYGTKEMIEDPTGELTPDSEILEVELSNQFYEARRIDQWPVE